MNTTSSAATNVAVKIAATDTEAAIAKDAASKKTENTKTIE